jgi:hypothetical protein
MGEALAEEFDGRVLNPDGVVIDLPYWVFKRLKRLHLLERDHVTGMRRICGRVFGLMEIWEGPDFRADRTLHAFDPGYQGRVRKMVGVRARFLRRWGGTARGL